MTQRTIQCPQSMVPHLRKVFAGEYDVPAYQHPAPVILDVGANVGAFAVWALERWPGATVHCYEPMADNFEVLRMNLADFAGRVTLHNVAIGNPAHTVMFRGRNNCGEASLYRGPQQTGDTVSIVTEPAASLPTANVLKLDTEGAEVEILSNLPRIGFELIVLEYHSERNRREVDALLSDYSLVAADVTVAGVGIVKYVRSDLLR